MVKGKGWQGGGQNDKTYLMHLPKTIIDINFTHTAYGKLQVDFALRLLSVCLNCSQTDHTKAKKVYTEDTAANEHKLQQR